MQPIWEINGAASRTQLCLWEVWKTITLPTVAVSVDAIPTLTRLLLANARVCSCALVVPNPTVIVSANHRQTIPYRLRPMTSFGQVCVLVWVSHLSTFTLSLLLPHKSTTLMTIGPELTLSSLKNDPMEFDISARHRSNIVASTLTLVVLVLASR